MLPLGQTVRVTSGVWAGHVGVVVDPGETPRVVLDYHSGRVQVRLDESKLEAVEEAK